MPPRENTTRPDHPKSTTVSAMKTLPRSLKKTPQCFNDLSHTTTACHKPHLQPRHPRDADHAVKADVLRRYKSNHYVAVRTITCRADPEQSNWFSDCTDLTTSEKLAGTVPRLSFCNLEQLVAFVRSRRRRAPSRAKTLSGSCESLRDVKAEE